MEYLIYDDGIIVDDPLNMGHLLIKYYFEELQDDWTFYIKKLNTM